MCCSQLRFVRRKSSQASPSCRKAAAALLLKRRHEPYSQTISNGRVLPFDAAAAAAYADIFAARRRAGRPTAPLDLMIAAVARASGAGVVTRNIGGFENCGVPLADPWQPLS